jgi:predicted ATPase/DNA-binding SARP family transcriptional activator
VRIRTLGPLEVVDDAGRRVALPAAKERMLLWLLLIAPGRLTTNDHLVDALWEGHPPPTAITTLRSLVSRLRKALGNPGCIEARPSGYVLVVDAGEVDSSRFEALLVTARECVRYDISAGVAAYRQALELWHGGAFAEVAHTEWAQGVAAHLETDRLVATEELFEAELSRGRHREVAAELETACRDHPLRERFWGQLMLALYRNGRQADALRACQHLRNTLAEELGLDPSPEVVRLEHAILTHDPSLDWQSSGNGAPWVGGGSRTDRLVVVMAEVEGPGKLAEQLGPAWPSALERYKAIMAEAFEAEDASTIRWRGTQVTACVPQLVGAVDACVAAMRGIRADSVLAGTGWTIAVGAAEGEAVAVGGDLVGMVVQQAAGVMAVANGGQILVTRDVTGPSVRTVPVGTFLVEAFGGPVTLFRVHAEGLPDRLEAPRAQDVMAERLPAWPVPLVGREADLDGLRDVAGSVPLLTVVGPGGCGKTRLAVELARRAAPSFSHDAWMVDLAAIDTDDQVVSAMAVQLGISLARTDQLSELIGELNGRRCFVVLDNCEHVLEGAAALADAVGKRAPSVRLLATSREPLNIPAETVWHLQPLTLAREGSSQAEAMEASAVRLLVERVQAKDPTFALTEDMVGPACELVSSLDGLPLAIELAAARATAGGAGAVQPLGNVLRALRGYRTSVRRQFTLESTVGWSHDLLSEPEQRLFRRLSVFRGGFSAQAADAVCEGGEELARLVDKSLVALAQRDAPQRFRLYEVIGDYASERLDEAGEVLRLRERHLKIFADLASRHAGTERPDIEAIGEEYDNLRSALGTAVESGAQAALALASSLATYWQVRGMWSEGREWLTRALALDGGSDEARARCLIGRSVFAVGTGHTKAAEVDARTALELPVDASLRAQTLRVLAASLTRQAKYETAWPIWNSARDAARSADDQLGEVDALRGLGSCAYLMGDFTISAELTEIGLDIGRRIGANALVGSLLNNLGQALTQSAAYDRAQEALEESLRMRQDSGHLKGQASALNSLAENSARLHNHHTAVSFARAAYQLFADLDDKERFLAAGNLAVGRLETGYPEAALVLLGALSVEDLGVADHEQTRFETAASRAAAALDASRASAAYEHGRTIGVSAAVRFGDDVTGSHHLAASA